METKFVLIPLLLLIAKSYQKDFEVETASEQGSESLDEKSGKRFAFEMFENMDGSHMVYKQETKLIKKLQEIKCQLQATRLALKGKTDLPQIITDLKDLKHNIKTFRDNVKNITSEFPQEIDYAGAQKGLLTLFYTYHFDAAKTVVNNTLEYFDHLAQKKSFPTHEKMDIKEYAKLIDMAIENKNYALAIYILRDLMNIKSFTKVMDQKFLKWFEVTKSNLIKLNNGYLERSQSFLPKLGEYTPYIVNKKLLKKKKQPDFVLNGKVGRADIRSDSSNDWLFLKICREGRFLPPKYQPNTFCRFLHHGNPYLKLGPFKEERLSSIPNAVKFQDILSEKEMSFLKDTAAPQLSRAKNFHQDNSKIKFNHQKKKMRKIIHKTVQAWLPEVKWPDQFPEYYVGENYLRMNYPILWKLARKIQLATQLKTQTHFGATEMQVTNYGLGGLCEVHVDPHGMMEAESLPPSRQYLKYTGDMIGTFMAWLDHTEAGGSTAFCMNGYERVMTPEKGAAAFWYDLETNGLRDHNTRHGGCPIIKGSKWILNKWMYAYDNFAKFPCDTKPKTKIKEPDSSHYFK